MGKTPSRPLVAGLLSCVLAASARADEPVSDAEYYRRACGGGFSSGVSLAQAPPQIAKGTPTSVPTQAAAAPSDPEALAQVAQMVAAHGGLARWQRARTFSFTHVLTFGEPLRTEWFVSHETTEIATRRTYQDWPLYGGQLAHDGRRTWTVDWKIGNPPGVNVNSAYEVLALPWLTQERGVRLQSHGTKALPGNPTSYPVVRMTFEPSRNESPYKYFELYIHPETHRLDAVAYDITYGAFLDLIELPRGKTSLGPFVHVFYRHVNVDGLLLPAQYDTFDPAQQSSGRHAVYGYSLARRFDASRMTVPDRAVIDTSTATRRP